ncbi:MULTISPECIES: molybdopterin-containing oxidoreductase family protein [Mycobacteriaceae]|uniref:Molybdopterin-dependent oxidoreductase n=1 Tax=Mycolicibacterium parafortuitum TaxID=39692 RepID=A0ACC6MJR7_MYCPF|nr:MULTISPECIES: molybdopterin-dependent oxidoreductase [Mycobacteriaceae]MDZ5087174.1 molybdopterin-dependent oxidoreductase [Mycolicibacterium parafortuitum]GFM17340.1 molydopterin dinucleotide-binding region [Mycobacterium sp. PO1]GFM22245.1 molydopterin dinucleotide-binding region [Mycobacterium sp. PO2]
MPQTTTHPGICRICSAHCGVLATVTDGRLTKVAGDPDNPMFQGYTCAKGRALPEIHNDPKRLLHSRKRQTDGTYARIGSEQAMEEIAEKLREILAAHGPRSVAMYLGTNGLPYPASALMGNAFMRGIGSPMFFTANTIDQPGKQIALAAHGHWLGGDVDFHEADSWLLIGTNPLVSKAIGIPGQNPSRNLRAATARGMKLIVIDPRRSQTAARAAIHLQPRPGEDATILAGLINIIIGNGWHDAAFVDENVAGFEDLARAVSDFTPDYVAERADIPLEQLLAAAELFATYGTKRGMVNAGTGANFAMHGNLVEYLCLCLTTICGRWQRAGEKVTRPNALLPAFTAKAQAHPPYEGWGYGEKLRVRGLTDAVCGMPTAALADEILLEGDGQVKALICIGGNPMAAWPDQRKTHRALQSLELLVTLDTEMSLTSRLADYVIAPMMQMETPAMTMGSELIKYYTSGTGIPAAYAQYTPRVVDPPPGSDLIEEWKFFLGLTKRMDLELWFVNFFGGGGGKFMESAPIVLPMNRETELSTEELFEQMCATARIPLDEVRRHPHGAIFDVDAVVQERDADTTARLDVGNAYMLAELAAVLDEEVDGARADSAFPFRLIPRRHPNFMNSSGTALAALNRGKPYNPVYMHPDAVAELGLRSGCSVMVTSRHDSVPAVLESDDSVRPDVVAMHHAFGGLPDEDDEFRERGTNVGRLVSTEVDYDPITGLPRQGNIAVRVAPLGQG